MTGAEGVLHFRDGAQAVVGHMLLLHLHVQYQKSLHSTDFSPGLCTHQVMPEGLGY